MLGKFILLFLVWVGLTNSLHYQELIAGAGVAFVITFLTSKSGLHIAWSAVIRRYLRFIPTFIIALVRSNLEVARIVLSPKITVRPGIVKLHTSLKSDHDKLLLANAITLTPGTLTIELRGDALFIHVLDLHTQDIAQLHREIIEPFESLLQEAPVRIHDCTMHITAHPATNRAEHPATWREIFSVFGF